VYRQIELIPVSWSVFMRFAILAATFLVVSPSALPQGESDRAEAARKAGANLLKARLAKRAPERVTALQRLAELGRDAAPALAEILACLDHGDEDERLNAALVLGGIGEPAVKPLIERLSSKEATVRYYSAWSLGLNGPLAASAADTLTKSLSDKDESVRRKAAAALGRLNLDHGRPLPGLVVLLGDKNADVADAAAAATVFFGERAVPILVNAIENKSPGWHRAVACLGELGPRAVRAAQTLGSLVEGNNAGDLAANSLGRMGTAAIPQLAPRLEHQEKAVRKRALQGLLLMRLDAVPCLLENANSKYDDMRLAAVQSLSKLGVRDGAAVSVYIVAVKDSVREVRQAGIAGIAALGSRDAAPGFDALTNALLDTDGVLRSQAKAALMTLAHDPIPALRAMVSDKEIRRRVAAGETLAVLYSDKTGVAAMTEGLADVDAAVRFQSAFGLAFAGSESAKTLPVLAEMQRSKEDAVRGRAVTALERVVKTEAGAVPLLSAALSDSNKHIRFHAALYLGNTGPTAKPALPALIKVLEDAQPDVILQAVWAIPKIGASVETTLPGLKRLMATEPTRYQVEYWLNQKGPEWVPLLVAGLEAPEAPFRLTCVAVLGGRRIADPKVMALMEKIALTDKDAETRRCSAAALGNIGDPAGKHMVACLRAEDLAVRDVALNWLSHHERDPKLYLPAIVNLLKDDLPRARLAAAFTLDLLGTRAKAALPALRPLLNDPDPAVRARAADAISRIGQKE